MSYQITCDKDVMYWFDSQSEEKKSRLYFEVVLGSRSRTYLVMDKTESGGRPISQVFFRVNKNFVKRFETKELPSAFINIRYLAIVRKLDAPKMEGVNNSSNIFNSVKESLK